MYAYTNIKTLCIFIIVSLSSSAIGEETNTDFVGYPIVVTGTIDPEELKNNPVLPEAYTCTLENLVRHIEVEYASLDEVPCKVNYHKAVEAPNKTQVLWNANNVEGFCERQASVFAEKLRGLGWYCVTKDIDQALSAN